MDAAPPAVGELNGEVLRAARSGCSGDAGAIAWVEGPLRRHMERGQLLARLPEALSWSVTGGDGKDGIYRTCASAPVRPRQRLAGGEGATRASAY